MEDVAWVSIMGTVGMLVVVVVIVVQLLVLFATNPDARGPTEVVTTGSLQVRQLTSPCLAGQFTLCNSLTNTLGCCCSRPP
jgi:hypothetical protein